jgi:translocation and assembly module TamA
VRSLLRPVAFLCVALLCPSVRAADPQPYTVALAPTGDAALDRALNDSSTLISLRAAAPVGPFSLIGRARDDAARFQTALESFGYYAGKVEIRVGGHPLDDPHLPAILAALPAAPPVKVTANLVLGPLFRLGQVRIEGTVPEEARRALGLASGQPARAADVLAARTRLLAALQSAGYALAKVDEPLAILHPPAHTLDVTFTVVTGPRVDLGPISITGLKTVNESFVRRRLTIHPGERFSPEKLAAARQDLASLPVFAAVSVQPATAANAQGRLPVTIHITERPLHVVSLGASYSTDLGVGLNASWEDRNLFGNAEDLLLSASTNFGGTAINGIGYNLNATFTKPDFLARDQSLAINLGTVEQNLYAYDQVAVLGSVSLSRPLLPYLKGSIAVAGERERITQNDVANDYTLIGLPLGLTYDSTNSLLEPTRGVRANLTLTPTYSFGPPSAPFVLAELSASTYLDFSRFAGEKPGRSVLAVRGLIGSAFGAPLSDVPPDKRFYAGGTGTIRGYKYLSVGPLFPSGKPEGGTAISAGSLELRQRFLANWGVAAFVDAGQVTTTGSPFNGTVRVGAGGGLRYYTPIGPIRLDVAVPLTRLPGGDAFELYIGIGEAF